MRAIAFLVLYVLTGNVIAEPMNLSSNILGRVYLDSRDLADFKKFLPYARRVQELSLNFGGGPLQIQTTIYDSEMNKNALAIALAGGSLAYHDGLGLIFLGGLSPRAHDIRSESAQRAASLHELGHVFLTRVFAKKLTEVKGRESTVLNLTWESFLPFHELFADIFASILVDDPGALTDELLDYAAYLRQRQGELGSVGDLAVRFNFLPDYRKIQADLAQRNVSTGFLTVCTFERDTHNWFPGTRQYLWEIYSVKYKRDPQKAGPLLKTLAEDLFSVLLRGDAALRARQAKLVTLTPSGSWGLGEDQELGLPIYLELGSEYHDEAMVTRLRKILH